MEDVACRVEAASPLELDRVQTLLGEGIVGTLAAAEDASALEAAGGGIVKASFSHFFFFAATIPTFLACRTVRRNQ